MKILLAGSALITACSKMCVHSVTDEDSLSESIPAGSGFYELSVGMDNFGSGVFSTKGESDISTPYIIVFENGKTIDYKIGGSASFFLRKGNYRVYAVIGIDDVSSFLSENSLKAHMVDLAEEEDRNFTMIGYRDISVPETLQANIDVTRGISKIVVKDVFVNFRTASMKEKTLNINNSWICNAARNILLENILTGINVPEAYYNDAYWHAELEPILYSGHIGHNMANNQTFGLNKVFYTFPNTAGIKKTRFILECYLDGKICYYPVIFDELKPNHVYTVTKITITKKGIEIPEGPWEEDIAVSASITVAPWCDGENANVER